IFMIFLFFFFSSRRRHTRFSRDWSSDVCSSDLPHGMYQDRYRRPPEPTRDAVASFAPAVILRRRSQRGLVDVFRKIEAQLEQSRRVLDGLLPLFDPDFVPTVTLDQTEVSWDTDD